jgi:hypothetical protein
MVQLSKTKKGKPRKIPDLPFKYNQKRNKYIWKGQGIRPMRDRIIPFYFPSSLAKTARTFASI